VRTFLVGFHLGLACIGGEVLVNKDFFGVFYVMERDHIDNATVLAGGFGDDNVDYATAVTFSTILVAFPSSSLAVTSHSFLNL